MEKAKMNRWMMLACWLVGLIFAAGVTYNTMDSQGEDIKENRVDIKEVKEEVHTIQRGTDRISKDIETIKNNVGKLETANIKKRDEDREYQKEQRIVNSKILQELARWEAVKDGQNP